MIGRNVGAGVHRQHCEGLPYVLSLPPDAGDTEEALAPLGEEPLVFALLSLLIGIGEFVKAIRYDQAPVRGELPALGAEIVDWPLVLPWPAPAPLHQVAFAAHAINRVDDWRDIGDLAVIARLDVRGALRRSGS